MQLDSYNIGRILYVVMIKLECKLIEWTILILHRKMYKSYYMIIMKIDVCVIWNVVLTSFLEVNIEYTNRMKIDINDVAIRRKIEELYRSKTEWDLLLFDQYE